MSSRVYVFVYLIPAQTDRKFIISNLEIVQSSVRNGFEGHRKPRQGHTFFIFVFFLISMIMYNKMAMCNLWNGLLEGT